MPTLQTNTSLSEIAERLSALDDFVICGDNRYNKEYGITDRHIIGVLTAVVRDGKEIPINDWWYRLYVHLWCDLFPIRAFILKATHFPKWLKRKLK